MTRKMYLSGIGSFVDEPVASNLISSEWLFRDSSVLIWADSILIINRDYLALPKASEHMAVGLGEEVQLLLDRLITEGVLEVQDEHELFKNMDFEQAEMLAEIDLAARSAFYENESQTEEKRTPQILSHQGECLCGMEVLSLYQNSIAAQFLDRACLLDKKEVSYLKSTGFISTEQSALTALGAFKDLYRVSLPSFNPLEDGHIFCRKMRDKNCVKSDYCLANNRKFISAYVDRIMAARELPFIRELADLTDALANEIGSNEQAVKEAALRDIRKSQRRLREHYPRMKRWADAVCTVGAAAFGVAAVSEPLAMTASGIAVAMGVAMKNHAEKTLANNEWKLSYMDNLSSQNACKDL